MKSHCVITFFIIIFTLFSCNEESENIPYIPGTETIKERTIILYLIGEEYKISRWIGENLNLICQNLNSSVDNEKVNIIAYLDLMNSYGTIPSNPIAYEIKYNKALKRGDTTCIKLMNEQNSLSVKNVKNFLNLIKELYPAESYNLVWGSHGSGWYPNEKIVLGRSLGPDGDNYIELDEFEEAIPIDMKFDYILFDACFMSQAEVAMQLRHKAKYIIAAPSEIPIAGYPYNYINLMCNAENEDDYIELCRLFHENYTNESIGHTISLIKTDEINELANSFKAIVNSCEDSFLKSFNTHDVQNFDGQQYCFNYITCCYDMRDIATKLTSNDSLINEFDNALDKVIKYEAHTTQIAFSSVIKINSCCGITTYWPTSQNSVANNYYYNYDWCKASGIEYLLNYIID